MSRITATLAAVTIGASLAITPVAAHADSVSGPAPYCQFDAEYGLGVIGPSRGRVTVTVKSGTYYKGRLPVSRDEYSFRQFTLKAHRTIVVRVNGHRCETT